MACCGTVGDIAEAWRTDEGLSVWWIINDFSKLSDEVGGWYESPLFAFDDGCWSLCLFPNGETWNSTSGQLCTWLVRLDAGPPKTVYFTFCIVSSYAMEKTGKGDHEFSKDAYARGVQLWSRSELGCEKSRRMTDDVFILNCKLNRDVPSNAKAVMSDGRENVISSLKAILTEGRRADFTLKTGGREWPVHKMILEGRSKYFENMFLQEWVEDSEVRLEDIQEDTLGSVLQFIYTGEIEEGVTVENACDIFVAADRFLLEDLKSQCLVCMKDNMCMEIVGKALAIAKTYEEKELEERALEYIFQEGEGIFDSEEWKQFKRNHSSIVGEILEEIIKRERKKQRKEKSVFI